MLHIKRLRSAMILALAAATGCVPTKNVSIHSTPPGAALTVTKMVNGTSAGDVPAPKADDKTQVTGMQLQFPQDALPSYQVTAHLDRYRDNSITVTSDAQTDYNIPLLEYKRPIDSVQFEPTPTGRVYQLTPKVTQEMAFLQNLTEPPTLVGNQVQITPQHDDVDTDYLNIASSPISDLLVYQKVTKRADGSGYDSRIYKRSIKSGLETLLSPSSRAQEFTPTFTFGGEAVVFSSDNASDNPTLWEIPLNSGNFMKYLTRGEAADYAPSVGQSLMVYNSFPSKSLEPQIWRCGMDGREAGQVGNGISPQLSPDESLILYLAKGKNGAYQMWLMNKDGALPKQLTFNYEYDIADPRWSPDGKWIAFVCKAGKDEDHNPEADIWIMAADGSGKSIQVTQNGSCDTNPAWDRNGTTIYFRSNRGGAWNIWKVDLRPGVLQ